MAAMVDERGTQTRPDRAGMTPKVECRYYVRHFTVEEMALLRALIAAQPPCPVEAVLPAHRLVQARRRAQGHDGQGDDAGHAQGRPDHTAAAKMAAASAPTHGLRTGHRTAAGRRATTSSDGRRNCGRKTFPS